ncbi:hypothetical protein FACS1894140_1030 [Spirochaetia bacterium]|nr:hypothetical protein FACS1894140_1030 [Spirochaetia bacterium]
MENEIDTHPLLEAAFVADKKVFVPRVKKDELIFYRIHSPDGPWHYGSFNIREPITAGDSAAALSPVDFPAMVIVPGLAFDRSGRRLGRGGGYYDRFLAGLNAAGQKYTAIGLCMATQIVPEVPTENQDKKMDGIYSAP